MTPIHTMHTAEMRNLPPLSTNSSSPRAQGAVPTLFASGWARFGVWCLAALSLGASLAYMGAEERAPAAAYALDRDWASISPLGVDRTVEMPSPMAMPAPACAICGHVEAVLPLRTIDRGAGRKPAFQVRVRMDDGRLQTVRAVKSFEPGAAVTLKHGVLQAAHG